MWSSCDFNTSLFFDGCSKRTEAVRRKSVAFAQIFESLITDFFILFLHPSPLMDEYPLRAIKNDYWCSLNIRNSWREEGKHSNSKIFQSFIKTNFFFIYFSPKLFHRNVLSLIKQTLLILNLLKFHFFLLFAFSLRSLFGLSRHTVSLATIYDYVIFRFENTLKTKVQQKNHRFGYRPKAQRKV